MYRRWVLALIAAVPAMALLMSLVGYRRTGLGALGGIITAQGSVQCSLRRSTSPFSSARCWPPRNDRDRNRARDRQSCRRIRAASGRSVLSLGFCQRSSRVPTTSTSLSGLGGIIMVGSIVLPIMMTAGVPRTIAATLFLMGFALGYASSTSRTGPSIPKYL